MRFLCRLVSRFELSRVHDKVKGRISLFTVNLVHYFKRRSDFVLNRDHFHNNWMIHRFKCANDCRNIKIWCYGTAFPEVLLYLVQCERTIFDTKYDKMWCPISFEHQHSWDPDKLSGEGSSVEEFDSSDSMEQFTLLKMFLTFLFFFCVKFWKCTFIKQYFQDVKLGLWTLPECSFWHHLPHTPSLMNKPASSVEHLVGSYIFLLAPNFFLLGANWYLGQKCYFEAW